MKKYFRWNFEVQKNVQTRHRKVVKVAQKVDARRR